jgi:hypothetical protein
MIKYTVASAMMVLNMVGSRILVMPEHAREENGAECGNV